jgi:hypothetical protein
MVATVMIVPTSLPPLRKPGDAIRPDATVFDSQRIGHAFGSRVAPLLGTPPDGKSGEITRR